MVHPTRRTMAWVVFLAGMLPALAFAERKGRLIGKVLDDEGKPIQGVVVTVSATSAAQPDYREVKTTDKKGLFIVDFSEINVTYHYRFDKSGYQTLEAQQEWKLEGTQRFEWTMHAATSPALEGAAPASTSAPAVLAFNDGVTAIKAKDYATAVAKFRESVGHDPGLRQAWGALSVAHFNLAQYAEAAEAAEKAVALGSTDESVLVTRWQAYRNLGDEAKAAEALKQLETIGRLVEEAKRIHNEAVTLAKAARPHMAGRNGAILTLSYLGAERALQGYNVMGVAKASLEATVRYLAYNLGPEGIRVNAISAGPIKTLAAAGIAGFRKILGHVEGNAPLRRTVTIEDVGNVAAFLCSDLAAGVTGEVTYVDAGYNILGMTGIDDEH